MEKTKFTVSINAPRETVWNILWGETTYPEWTTPFCEGSRVVTNWNKGDKALFLDGNDRGMVSVIDDNIPNEFMSFRHIGDVKNGIEDVTSDKVKAWAGAHEDYTLTDVNGNTELLVELDLDEQHKQFFIDIFPKALQKAKELSEAAVK